jgi:hypothetical protein
MKIIRKIQIILSLALIATTSCANGTAESPSTNQPVIEKKMSVPVLSEGLQGRVVEINIYGTQNTNAESYERHCAHHGEAPKPESLVFDHQVLEASIKLISAIAWPLVAIVVILLFRKEIATLIGRLKGAQWGSAGLVFADQVKEAEEEANIPPPQIEPEEISRAALEKASSDPRGTILTAWVEVEAALNQLIKTKQLASDYTRISKRPLTSFRLVQKAELLDTNYIGLFHDLRVLRNEAAHSADFAPPSDAVIRYVRLAKELAAELKRKAA